MINAKLANVDKLTEIVQQLVSSREHSEKATASQTDPEAFENNVSENNQHCNSSPNTADPGEYLFNINHQIKTGWS